MSELNETLKSIPTKRRLVAEEWEFYASEVLSPQASPIQRVETRRAFYAGAQAVLCKIIGRLSPSAEATADDLEMMQNLFDELQEFMVSVVQGKDTL